MATVQTILKARALLEKVGIELVVDDDIIVVIDTRDGGVEEFRIDEQWRVDSLYNDLMEIYSKRIEPIKRLRERSEAKSDAMYAKLVRGLEEE